MRFTRYVRTTADPPPDRLLVSTSAMERLRELPDGTLLLRCEFASELDMRFARTSTGVTFLPSLSTPADRLSQAVQDWLTARGVTLEDGDTVLNALRKLRDATGGNFFDVSLSE